MPPVRIVGCGATKLGRLGRSAGDLGIEALQLALHDARMTKSDLHGLVAVPSLSDPHFMQAHYLATVSGLLPSKRMVVRTVDTGGAGPISSLATAVSMIEREWCDTVAIVASDAVLSLPSREFLGRADASVAGSDLPSPCIPSGYDRIAQWHMKRYGVTREQLAMVSVLMSSQALRHPDALCRVPHTLQEVLNSPQIAPVTSLLECARRADGAACVILSSQRHYKRNFDKPLASCPVVVACGEASGPLFPPQGRDSDGVPDIPEDMFSCEAAATRAYAQAHCSVHDIDYFSLYDCFPICFLRALEAVGIAPRGGAGAWIERHHDALLALQAAETSGEDSPISPDGSVTAAVRRPVALPPAEFPINTHGGLTGFGAPWEVPAMYGVLEAVAQLTQSAGERQVCPKPRRALVYGNGGIFSSSAVAILGDGVYGHSGSHSTEGGRLSGRLV
eukprot:TRINITY_DN14634_c0_g1_i1.p1 TRINITY_DN14634_c0_g1~~TRINITY_DN14634_c0_g1_i1.p1  ORF type:complete len:448 (+),score=60.39 TRINITY_DN14634_c0_g1_i1:100-1443(+)